MADRIENDRYYAGTVTFNNKPKVPAGAFGDSEIAAGAGLQQTKLQHQHAKHYAQPNSTATTETKVLHTVYGATGTLLSFKAGSIAIAVGAATVTLDLKKNGSSVLASVITLNSSNTARVAVSASLSVTSIVAGDVLEIVVTATAGGGTLQTGVFAELRLAEDAA